MAQRRLSLSKEALADMTTDELRGVAGAAAWTGQVSCIVSCDPCLTLVACTVLCGDIG